MEKILENLLLSKYRFNERQYPEEWRRILTNRGMLKKGFNKWQKRRLMCIMNDYGLIFENVSIDSFEAGVRYGVKFMTEVFHNPAKTEH